MLSMCMQLLLTLLLTYRVISSPFASTTVPPVILEEDKKEEKGNGIDIMKGEKSEQIFNKG